MFSKKIILPLIAAFYFLALPPTLSFAQQSETLTGTVTDNSSGAALPGVNIRIVGTKQGTVTNRNGNYSLTISSKKSVELKFSFIGYKSKTRNVSLGRTKEKVTLNIALTPTFISGNEVVVTGTHTGGRSKLESAEPIDVIQVQDLNISSPQIDLNHLLTFVAPSFQSNRQSAADEESHIAPASLRGMGPDQVLVLINGKRRHPSSIINLIGGKRGTVGTDLSVIPTASIDHIEILREGASTQYGSDAIAGVINIILKKDTGHFQGSATGGAYKAGDGQTAKADANYGFELGDGGFMNITGSFTNRETTNHTGEHDLHVYTPGFAYPLDDNPEAERAKDNEAIRNHGYNRDHFDFHIGDAAMQIASTFINAALPIDENGTEIYVFGGLSNKKGTGYPFRRLPVENTNVDAIYPAGFQPLTKSSITDQSITMGIRGNANGWNIDFSNTYGRNKFGFRLENSVNASLLASSPTAFDVGGFAFSQNITELTFSKLYDQALSGINVAFGSEFRVDNYSINAGEEASWKNYGIVDSVANGRVVGQVDTLGRPGGSQGYPGFRPSDAVDANRTNIAAFADVEIDFTPQLLVGVAGRFERYSDFGNTLNGKISARYLFGNFLTLRGAISTGFRAPSLQQVYYNKVSSDFNDNNRLVKIGTFNNNSRPAKLLGIPDLKEETSRNYSLGFALRPTPNLSLTADLYQIDVDNRIILTSDFNVSDLPSDIAGEFNEFGVQSANFFTNAIDTRTRGLDIVASYNRLLKGGNKLSISLAGNINDVKIQGAVKTSPQLENQADLYLQPWDRLQLEEGNPRTKFTGSINYDLGRFSVLLREVRFGQVRLNTGGAFGVAQTYSPKYTTDISLTYKVLDGLALTAGSQNLLDAYPDEHKYANSYYNVFKYPPSQMGFNGAYYFAKLTFTY